MKKEIDINYSEGEDLDKIEIKGKITLKRLNFSEKNALEEESTDIKFIGSSPNVRISTTKLKELSILKGVVNSDLIKTTYDQDKVTKKPIPINKPYDLNIVGIKDLPAELGELLFMEFTEINTVSPKKNMN
jgi:hypothetical protein